MTREQMDYYFKNYMKIKDECKSDRYDLDKSLACGALCKHLLEQLLKTAGYNLDEEFNPDDFAFLENRK